MIATGFPLFPPEGSTIAGRVDLLVLVLTAVCALFAVTLAALIVFFAARYRHTRTIARSPANPNAKRIEALFVGGPLLAFTGVFVWAALLFFHARTIPAGALEIYVVGKQWMWKVQHPGGQREIDALHVPVHTPIKLILTSQDVIHDFGLPAFRIKQDVLPGRYTTAWFTATRIGEFPIYCDQYCGALHSAMIGKVVVLSRADYEAWLGPAGGVTAAIPGTPGTLGARMAVAGKGAFFQLGCNACHVPESAVRAPRLVGLFGREVALANGQRIIADENYLRESILDPNAKIAAGYAAPSLMPSYRGQVTDEQLNELIAYIKSLAPTAAAPSATAPSLPGTTQPALPSELRRSPP